MPISPTNKMSNVAGMTIDKNLCAPHVENSEIPYCEVQSVIIRDYSNIWPDAG